MRRITALAVLVCAPVLAAERGHVEVCDELGPRAARVKWTAVQTCGVRPRCTSFARVEVRYPATERRPVLAFRVEGDTKLGAPPISLEVECRPRALRVGIENGVRVTLLFDPAARRFSLEPEVHRTIAALWSRGARDAEHEAWRWGRLLIPLGVVDPVLRDEVELLIARGELAAGRLEDARRRLDEVKHLPERRAPLVSQLEQAEAEARRRKDRADR